jgi:hypothetical protein
LTALPTKCSAVRVESAGPDADDVDGAAGVWAAAARGAIAEATPASVAPPKNARRCKLDGGCSTAMMFSLFPQIMS